MRDFFRWLWRWIAEMFTRQRMRFPTLSGDWRVDGPLLLRAINEYFLGLEARGSLESEASGKYTPILTETGTNNISGAPASVGAQWMRIGNVVTVSGRATVSSTNTTMTQFTVSTPIPVEAGTSNIAGTCLAIYSTSLDEGWVDGDGAGGAQVNYVCSNTSGTQDVYYHFTYLTASP